MKRINACFAAFLFFVVAMAAGCQNGGNTITGPSPITPGNVGNNEIKDSDLFNYNAKFHDGRTGRWDKNPITVYDGIGLAEIQNFLTEWNQYLNGRRLVLTSSSNPDIEINYGDTNSTNVAEQNGVFNKAWITMRNLPHDGGFLKAAVKHEIGHSIGFSGHTTDSGLMDAYGNTDNITPTVAGVITKLYGLPPGTKVVPG
jgi:predicted Zn-dependent protease